MSALNSPRTRGRARTTTPPSDAAKGSALADVEQAMVRIRRSMTRRTLGKLLNRDLGGAVDASWLAVNDAVEQGPDEHHQEVTVGAVAERLGIDPSRASRMVAATIQAGYIRRVASQTDGRRIGLELTDAGRELAWAAHRSRQAFFAKLMQDWSDHDQREFARLLTKFVDAADSINRSI